MLRYLQQTGERHERLSMVSQTEDKIMNDYQMSELLDYPDPLIDGTYDDDPMEMVE